MNPMLLVLSGIFFSGCLHGQILPVPIGYRTIQDAINRAVEGDTVLVAPGTYFENITFMNKNITVASHFLLTGDTSHISGTVIDGSHNGSVVTLSGNLDSTARLIGFTLKNGLSEVGGGLRISCTVTSSCCEPSVSYLHVVDNEAVSGGGIACHPEANWSQVRPTLKHILISHNQAVNGGGIYFKSYFDSYGGYAGANMEEIKLVENSAAKTGGGIFLCSANSRFSNVVITNNHAHGQGGGIFFDRKYNVIFDSLDRCDIYFNRASEGSDLFASYDEKVNIYIDTFTVLEPTSFLSELTAKMTTDILHAKLMQTTADLFVSPSGNDQNSGLTTDDPLKTIYRALSILVADSVYTGNLYLAQGRFSPTSNGEFFPVGIPDYVKIEGVSDSLTVLDAEHMAGVIRITGGKSNQIRNITIKGGYAERGGGAFVAKSKLIMENVKIVGNSAYGEGLGGGLFCSSSKITLNGLTIDSNSSQMGGGIFAYLSQLNGDFCVSGNSAIQGGGIFFSSASQPLTNILVTNNTALDKGGGIYCMNASPTLTNLLLIGNMASLGGGIACTYYSEPKIENTCIASNSAARGGGGVYCGLASGPLLVNTILWNNDHDEILFSGSDEPNSATLTYCDVKGGQSGIETNENGTLSWLEGNIDVDPAFYGQGDDPYSVKPGSPCIDSGIPDTIGLYLPLTDHSGNPRIWGGRIDIGPYEWNNISVAELKSLHGKLSVTAYPNPFCSEVTFEYELSVNSKVQIRVYDLLGRRISEPFDGIQEKGLHHVKWTTNGQSVPHGLFYYKVQTESKTGVGVILKR